MINSYTQNSKNSKNYQNNKNSKNNKNNKKTFFDKLFIFLKHPLFIFFLYVILMFFFVYVIRDQSFKIDLLTKRNILLKQFNECASKVDELEEVINTKEGYYVLIIQITLAYIRELIELYGINNLPRKILNIIREFYPEYYHIIK